MKTPSVGELFFNCSTGELGTVRYCSPHHVLVTWPESPETPAILHLIATQEPPITLPPSSLFPKPLDLSWIDALEARYVGGAA